MPGGERWQNVLHFGANTLGVTEQNAIEAATGSFYTQWAFQAASGWTFDRLQMGLVGQGTAVELDVTGVAGQGSGTALPNDVAICISWATAVTSRHGKGRTFLGGLHHNMLQRLGGTAGAPGLADSLADAVVLVAQELNDAGAGGFVIYSRSLDAGYLVTGGRVNRRLATQRRRDMDTPGLVEVFDFA